MKIALLCDRIDGEGGWFTYARDLRDALHGRGHDVCVVRRRDAAGEGEALLPGAMRLFGAPWSAWAAARRLLEFLEREQPDIVHVAVEPYALLVPFLPARWRDRMVLTIHGTYGVRPLRGLVTRVLAKRYYAQVARFVTVSDFTRRTVESELRGMGWTDIADRFSSRVTTVRHGIALPPFVPRSRSDGPHRILLVGGVKPRKGGLEAVKACAEYKRRYGKSFTFSLAGEFREDDSYVRTLRACIADNGLQENVRLLGLVDQPTLERLYAEADLYLMPALTSRETFEGFGLAYLEANARGVPCIGPDDSGAAEAIDEGKSGYRVDPSRTDMIAERMHWILDERRIDSAACRQWAESHTLEQMVRGVEEAYRLL